jgi:hypothetical protein
VRRNIAEYVLIDYSVIVIGCADELPGPREVIPHKRTHVRTAHDDVTIRFGRCPGATVWRVINIAFRVAVCGTER